MANDLFKKALLKIIVDEKLPADPRKRENGSGSDDPKQHHPAETYVDLYLAFHFFNDVLFGGKLPTCMITYQRHPGAVAYYSSKRLERVANSNDVQDEIALNPSYFVDPVAALAALVHEMTHQAQDYYGQPSRGRYHNREWADMMIAVGLIPSDTGQPGGMQTGDRMSHYIDENGPFQEACRKFLQTNTATLYRDRASLKRSSRSKVESKIKYSCPCCHLNAWAKPNARFICGSCNQSMRSVDQFTQKPSEALHQI